MWERRFRKLPSPLPEARFSLEGTFSGATLTSSCIGLTTDSLPLAPCHGGLFSIECALDLDAACRKRWPRDCGGTFSFWYGYGPTAVSAAKSCVGPMLFLLCWLETTRCRLEMSPPGARLSSGSGTCCCWLGNVRRVSSAGAGEDARSSRLDSPGSCGSACSRRLTGILVRLERSARGASRRGPFTLETNSSSETSESIGETLSSPGLLAFIFVSHDLR